MDDGEVWGVGKRVVRGARGIGGDGYFFGGGGEVLLV